MATSLLLLLSSTFSPLKAKPSLYFSILSTPKTLRHFTALPSLPQRPANGNRRTRSCNAHLGHRKDGAFAEAMEESEPSSFNRMRAEGNDGGFMKKKKTLKLRESKSRNTTNSLSYVQILGTGMDAQDTLPSVLLFFENKRFIFNAGEGLQRYCAEHKIKLSKVDHIFLSRVSSETTGGVPGLFLSMANMGEEGISVNLWGTSDLNYLVNAMSTFIPNAALVHTRCFGPSPSSDAAPNPITTSEPIVLIDDEVVKISAVLLQPKFLGGSPILDEEVVSGSPLEKDLKERMHHFSQTNAPNKPGDMSVIYVCELPEVKGTFHPERAMALGLRPGPKYQKLQLGNSVKSDHKNIMVHPSDVMDPSLPGPVIFLVDCPTESHMQELSHIESLNGYYKDFPGNPTEGANSVACIIHLTPTSIVSSPSYQSWMKRFGSAQHIMAGHETKNVEIPVLNSSARIAARLNYLCPQLFPFPGSCSRELLNYSEPSSTASSEEDSISKLCEGVAAENLLRFTLRPYAQLGLDRSCVPSLKTPSEIVNELLIEIPEIEDAAREVGQFWNESGTRTEQLKSMKDNEGVIEEYWLNESTIPRCLENVRKDDLEITFLGTGSSEPSKYRNVTSIYINLFSNGGVLLDCGEGTLGQLRRRYGVKKADEIVRGLRCIWISHIHADHHTGVTRLLALRRELLNGVPHEPLVVVGPGQLWKFLKGYKSLQDLDMQFLDCKHTTAASLDAFEVGTESNKDDSSIGSLDSTLFAKGSPMQSYWNRSGNPVDNGMTVSILKSLKRVLADAGIAELVSFPVVHCPQAYGVVLKATERINSVGKIIPGWKVVYSGDTRPCPALIEAARDATVLIHEATFEDSMMDEAVARNHSTTKEAMQVGASAGAYRVILTHFSQRYPKIPVLEEEHMHRTSIAFDMMTVNVADLHVIPRLIPYIKLLFRNEVTVDECDEDVESVAS